MRVAAVVALLCQDVDMNCNHLVRIGECKGHSAEPEAVRFTPSKSKLLTRIETPLK